MLVYPKKLLKTFNDVNLMPEISQIPEVIIVIILQYASIVFDFYKNENDTVECKLSISSWDEIDNLNSLPIPKKYYNLDITLNLTPIFTGIHKLYFKIDKTTKNPFDDATVFPRFRIRNQPINNLCWGNPFITNNKSYKSPTCLYVSHRNIQISQKYSLLWS